MICLRKLKWVSSSRWNTYWTVPPPLFFLKEKTTDLKLLHFWKLSTIHRRALCNVTPAMVCTPYNIVIVVILGNDPDDKVCLENLIKTLQTINFWWTPACVLCVFIRQVEDDLAQFSRDCFSDRLHEPCHHDFHMWPLVADLPLKSAIWHYFRPSEEHWDIWPLSGGHYIYIIIHFGPFPWPVLSFCILICC